MRVPTWRFDFRVVPPLAAPFHFTCLRFTLSHHVSTVYNVHVLKISIDVGSKTCMLIGVKLVSKFVWKLVPEIST